MTRLTWSAVVFGFLGLGSFPLWGQPKADLAALPITRVVLFTSGVGYFQREGEVDGNARIDLQFPVNDINDILKSLKLEDASGKLGAITFDNRNPVEQTLKTFSLDLTNNPSLNNILNQARGERVEIVLDDEPLTKNLHTEKVVGIIVGVEKAAAPRGDEKSLSQFRVNVLSQDGLQGIALSRINRLRFLKPEIDGEFRQALALLAASHDKHKKAVTLTFAGKGKRHARVSYIREMPLWKTTYRLDIKDGKVFLQGCAVVENTTDQDWNNVHIGLVSGRPISFRMDLYEPLFPARPLVEPELFASLRPPTYNANMDNPPSDPKAGLSESEGNKRGALPKGQSMPAGLAGIGGLGGIGGSGDGHWRGRLFVGRAAAQPGQTPNDSPGYTDLVPGIIDSVNAKELGEFFHYQIQEALNLARQRSSLVPIINQEVVGTKVSIYNEYVQNKYPLLGLRFTNASSLHLAQGPVTVSEASSYAGDAQIPYMQPRETRLLSYAVDLGMEVESDLKLSDHLLQLKVFKGTIIETRKFRRVTTYLVKNRSEHLRTLIIEHPYDPQNHLVKPEKPGERSRDYYRFAMRIPANHHDRLEVVEENSDEQQIEFKTLDESKVMAYIKSAGGIQKPRVKQALEHAITLKSAMSAINKEREKEDQALRAIESDQGRMRANMERLPPTSQAYQRYLKKFDDQEKDIEKRRAALAALRENHSQQQRAYEQFIQELTVD